MNFSQTTHTYYFKRATADVTVNNSGVFVDAGISLFLPVGRYSGLAEMKVQQEAGSAQQSQIKVVVVSGTMNVYRGSSGVLFAGVLADWALSIANLGSAGNDYIWGYQLYVVVTGAGTFKLQFTQGGAEAKNHIFRTGSNIVLLPV